MLMIVQVFLHDILIIKAPLYGCPLPLKEPILHHNQSSFLDLRCCCGGARACPQHRGLATLFLPTKSAFVAAAQLLARRRVVVVVARERSTNSTVRDMTLLLASTHSVLNSSTLFGQDFVIELFLFYVQGKSLRIVHSL